MFGLIGNNKKNNSWFSWDDMDTVFSCKFCESQNRNGIISGTGLIFNGKTEILISILPDHSDTGTSPFCIFSFTGPELFQLRTESNKARDKVYETQKINLYYAVRPAGFSDHTDTRISRVYRAKQRSQTVFL